MTWKLTTYSLMQGHHHYVLTDEQHTVLIDPLFFDPHFFMGLIEENMHPTHIVYTQKWVDAWASQNIQKVYPGVVYIHLWQGQSWPLPAKVVHQEMLPWGASVCQIDHFLFVGDLLQRCCNAPVGCELAQEYLKPFMIPHNMHKIKVLPCYGAGDSLSTFFKSKDESTSS